MKGTLLNHFFYNQYGRIQVLSLKAKHYFSKIGLKEVYDTLKTFSMKMDY